MKNRPIISRLLWAGLGLLCVLSFIFWKERVFMLDASFQSFGIVSKQEFAFQVQRYGAAIVQSIPLLMAKMGFSLKAILMGYTTSFTIYPLLIFGFLLWIKQREMAWGLALFFLIGLFHTFFWVQSELIQGTAFCFICFGILKSKLRPIFRLLLALPLLVLTIYTHPLVIVPLFFGLGYLAIDAEKNRINLKGEGGFLLLVLLLSAAIFYAKQFLIGTGDYDDKAVSTFAEIPNHLPNFFSLPAWTRFMRQVVENYQLIPIGLGILSFWFIRRKQWLKLLTIIGGLVGWLMIIIPNWWYGAEQFYIESYYLILGFMLAIPFAVDVLPTVKERYVATGLSLLVLYRVAMIIGLSVQYVDRQEYISSMVEVVNELPGQRFVVKKEAVDMKLLEMSWGLPYSSLMYSATAYGPSGVKNIMIYDKEQPEFVTVFEKSSFMTPWGPHKYDWIAGKEYFYFTDTARVEDVTELLRPLKRE